METSGVDPRVWSRDEPVVFFPVRHHSPACARLAGALVRALRPEAVLIEGPADFNARLGELHLPHELPIAIYSYYATADGVRHGAFYPFCEFSPEWVALQAARETGARIEFIDLPWADVAALDRTANRYADGPLARGRYTAELCRRLGVDDWNTLWDTLFEIDPALDAARFLERCHVFCHQARSAEGGASAADRAREAFMLDRIRAALAAGEARVLVVTGGFHSPALFAGLHGLPFEAAPSDAAADDAEQGTVTPDIVERGIALTPYSYERLDALTGYDAGLPNPGFYHRIWHDRRDGRAAAASHRKLLAAATAALRARGQRASTADLIGVETFAAGLASLRGHAAVWRTDLVDAIVGTLVKEELAAGGRHPLLDAVHEVFRGGARGVLASGTPLPPLVADIAARLREHDLEPRGAERRVEVALDAPEGLARSRVLHRVRLLGLPGFTRVDGTDFVGRGDMARLWEAWTLRWTPELDAACIENAVYGATLLDAAGARLAERGARIERDAEAAARLLLDASLAGWTAGFAQLHARVIELVRSDASFASVAHALEHLYYLHRYDEGAGAGRLETAALLAEAFDRAVWLLDAQPPPADAATLRGMRALLHALHTAGVALGWDAAELVGALQRLGAARATPPMLRGAAAGALWSLDEGDLAAILRALPAAPDTLGDFLHGVFALAREESQRHADLLVAIDRLLLAFDDEQFLAALPSLRLAFTYFTPREKDHLARRLLAAVGAGDAPPLPALAVPVALAERALRFEGRLVRELARHGLRGGEGA